MKYAVEYGTLFRLTDKNWLCYLAHKALGGVWSVGHFGTALGAVADVTDWTAAEATAARADTGRPA